MAFDENGRFLMVWNDRRDGWEMPGGHIENGETSEQAAEREYMEECGHRIRIVATRDIGHCDVCAAMLLEKRSDHPEMDEMMFSELPDRLSFDREEYLDTVPWALSEVEKHRSS